MLTHHDPLALHVYTDFGRFYSIDSQNYPGVGTILTATDTPNQQAFWEQWRSLPKNAAHSEQARSRGKLFHSIAEHHFQSKDFRLDAQDESAIAQLQPFWQSVQTVLPCITDPLLINTFRLSFKQYW